MPYTIEWLVPQRVISITFDKILTTTELVNYDEDICQRLDTGAPQQVHLITDIEHLTQFPTLKQAQQLKFVKHPNLGWSINVGNKNMLLRAIILLVTTLFGNRLHWCNTHEEAITFLQKMDKTISFS